MGSVLSATQNRLWLLYTECIAPYQVEFLKICFNNSRGFEIFFINLPRNLQEALPLLQNIVCLMVNSLIVNGKIVKDAASSWTTYSVRPWLYPKNAIVYRLWHCARPRSHHHLRRTGDPSDQLFTAETQSQRILSSSPCTYKEIKTTQSSGQVLAFGNLLIPTFHLQPFFS